MGIAAFVLTYLVNLLYKGKSSHSQEFYEKGVLKNLTKLTGKHFFLWS